ncbi:MAG: geranylgeranyl reductase family protein [Bacteroidales bacterium]|nr:geranylgeranyl reductase family protein [Bacteroidales bacterium]MCF8352007.1 geranylgeranyl reductase family protein [Bacteroidales bacterium]MCF8376578.1 geranylgeranyl reductase family protein [Bacteroidales bacterium]MCF8401163.1 geranylgeranyl reductase family protein [Bacteroidales bacterium]
MQDRLFDAVVVGAGPSGATCALHLEQMGYKVALLDKASFPREKICGDGLTGHVLFELNELGLLDDFLRLEKKNAIVGGRMYAPNGKYVDFRDVLGNQFNNDFCYIMNRGLFDNFLVEKIREKYRIQFVENFKVEEAAIEKDCAIVKGKNAVFKASVLIAADGASSILSRRLLKYKPDRGKMFVTAQAYYRGVEPIYENDMVEAFCAREILPGYLWIFPESDNIFNVGLGVVADVARKKKNNPVKILDELIVKYDFLSKRFAGAEKITNNRGGLIPFDTCKRKISGERFLLLGDAASITNPVTGEGIGYGMNSGRIAAHHLKNCFDSKDFSTAYMKQYDQAVAAKFRKILKRTMYLQKAIRFPGFINRIAGNISKNEKLHGKIERILADRKKYQEIYNPLFYYRIFFG